METDSMSIGGSSLWNQSQSATSYGDKYQDHLLEQYKIYVDGANKISDRRDKANAYFLTLHSFIVGTAGFIYEKAVLPFSCVLLLVGLAFTLTLCWSWHRIVTSYRQLNGVKFKVIAEFEKQLPAMPYGNAEWKMLGEGRDSSRYLPVSYVEQWVPRIFVGLYVIGAITVVVRHLRLL